MGDNTRSSPWVQSPIVSAASLRQSNLYKAGLPFLIGGSAGMAATICVQPIDMVKVRLQLSSGSPKPTPFSVARDIISSGHVLNLYSGLSAALLRQVVYGTARLGFFFTLENALESHAATTRRRVTFGERILASIAAGGLGAVIGNPTEVALIRMQSDGLKATAQRANYRSVFDALGRTVSNEGVAALWTGASATVVRAMATNLGQLAFFSETKAQLRKVEGFPDQARTLVASGVAGFFASFLSLPFDFVKTRLQQQVRAKDGVLPYKGVADCFVKVAREEGVRKFYVGFWTYFMRIAPHS
jgi:solute carrier family 25 oxoglutarate transporter 11